VLRSAFSGCVAGAPKARCRVKMGVESRQRPVFQTFVSRPRCTSLGGRSAHHLRPGSRQLHRVSVSIGAEALLHGGAPIHACCVTGASLHCQELEPDPMPSSVGAERGDGDHSIGLWPEGGKFGRPILLRPTTQSALGRLT